MTIFSGQTRISEEEDLWRVIGIREVTDSSASNLQRIDGYMESDNFYTLLNTDDPIYYDIEREVYRYKDGNDYPNCTVIEGYYTNRNFYESVILPENHVIYYDEDKDEYYIYEQSSYKNISPYSQNTLYYHDGGFYESKTNIGPNAISILNRIGEYERHPYVEGLLVNRIFYSNEVLTFDNENIYFNKNDELYYIYDEENEILIEATQYSQISPSGNIDNPNEVYCYSPRSPNADVRTLIEGYKIGNRFFKTIAAGYENPIVPIGSDDENIYYDQISNSYYTLESDNFIQLPYYDQMEESENILYYHNQNDNAILFHRVIIKGYFVNDIFYTDKVNGDATTIYRTSGTDNFWKYYSETDKFEPYEFTGLYEIGILYSDKVDPSSDYFYKDENNDVYYYDGNYHITIQRNGYYIPIVNKMCETKRTEFVEDNKNLYHSNDGYYIYKTQGSSLFSVNPISCYFRHDVPCKKENPALGAIYHDIEHNESFIYKNGAFEEYDNTPVISNENQIVLSLSKQDMLLDDNILDQNPYDEDVVLGEPTSQRAGIFTADLYNRFIDLENRYKLRISSTTYNTLSDLENDAPTDPNCIYIVGMNKQYVLSDDGTYVQIGNTDLSDLDLTNVASVNDINLLIDDVSDILEKIQKQDDNLQTQIDTKYSTANMITTLGDLRNPSHYNDAVSGKVVVDYVTGLLANSVTIDNLITETVVTGVEKYEDSLRVHYKEIATAAAPKYVNSLDPNSLDYDLINANHALSAILTKSLIDDLQDQINVMKGNGLVFGWASNDTSDVRINLVINNRVV